MRIEVVVTQALIDNQDGHPLPGRVLECQDCGHTVDVFGTGTASARRGAVILKDTCPVAPGQYFYVVD